MRVYVRLPYFISLRYFFFFRQLIDVLASITRANVCGDHNNKKSYDKHANDADDELNDARNQFYLKKRTTVPVLRIEFSAKCIRMKIESIHWKCFCFVLVLILSVTSDTSRSSDVRLMLSSSNEMRSNVCARNTSENHHFRLHRYTANCVWSACGKYRARAKKKKKIKQIRNESTRPGTQIALRETTYFAYVSRIERERTEKEKQTKSQSRRETRETHVIHTYSSRQ